MNTQDILTPKLTAELQALYKSVSEELQKYDLHCEACGRCCHLNEWGHEVWLTNIELAYLVKTPQPNDPSPKGVCPYLDANGTCRARQRRTLGCRIFYCHPSFIRRSTGEDGQTKSKGGQKGSQADQTTLEDLYNHFLQELRKIAHRHNVDLKYDELLSGLGSAKK